jgi:hypothetical protein
MDPVLLSVALALAPTVSPTPVRDYVVIGAPASAPRRSYPEPRWYLQSQGWWRPAGQNGVGEHIHVEAAVPIGQTVSGVLSLDVRIQLHAQPRGSKVNLFRILDESGTRLVEMPLSITPNEHGDADVWLRDVRIDTRKQKNGRREYRFTANMSTRADGNRQFQSTGWCWYVANLLGGLPTHYRSDTFHEARGWYTGANYANARFASRLPGPLTGEWRFDVKLLAGSDGARVTGHMITLDPDSHAGVRGQVVREASGPYSGSVSIDTRRLANGTHKLVLITHQDIAAGRNSGVLVVPFLVDN